MLFLAEIQDGVRSCCYAACVAVGILWSCDIIWSWKTETEECHAQISNENVTLTSANVNVS